MGSILVLGLLIGMKHAVEADHVAAVASLAGRNRSLGDALRMGLAWGLGHTVALFAVGAIVLSLDTVLPERIALILEFGVGIMLVWLGLDVIRRLIKARIHFHAHRHGDGTQHFHAHSHAQSQANEGAHNGVRHEHEHRGAIPLRALIVGLMHGMAGSAALIVLAIQTVQSVWQGLTYIALFGVGSIAGMALLSVIICIPMRSARTLTWAHNGLQATVGGSTAVLGVFTVIDSLVS